MVLLVPAHEGTSCPGFPTRSFVCCGLPQCSINFIQSYIDFLYLELPDSVETAPINEKHRVIHPYRNDGDMTNWDFRKAERPHNTKIWWLIAWLAEQTKPLNAFST